MKLPSIEDRYRKIMADHITVSVEDLTSNEYLIINMGWSMFEDKLTDIKTLEDEVKRLTLELVNLKAMYLDNMGHHDTDEED